MASPDIRSHFEHHLQIYGCTAAKGCLLAETQSCPMNQEVIVKSSLAPKRVHRDRHEHIDANDAKPFRAAVRMVGLIRRSAHRPVNDTHAKDLLQGRENAQYLCDKIGGMRGHVYIKML